MCSMLEKLKFIKYICGQESFIGSHVSRWLKFMGLIWLIPALRHFCVEMESAMPRREQYGFV